MRILLITSEEWNDFVYANGVLTNWFTDFEDAEFAQIYTSPGKPVNDICHKYFRITDAEMAKSVLGGKRAGHVIAMPKERTAVEQAKTNQQRQGIYMVFKKWSLRSPSLVKLIQESIWALGRYDKKALSKFIKDFNPDVVFCPRMVSPKLMRLEKLVSTMTDAPFVAFTGDNEAAINEYTRRRLGKIYERWRHNKFKKHASIYSHYLMHSADQAREYAADYGLITSTLFKCGDFPEKFAPKEPGRPIRLVYAGRLYCNRWKSLEQIGLALKGINKDGEKMVLDIYTQEQLTPEQAAALTADKSIYIKGSVTPEELTQIYREADIALHVESMESPYKDITRVSFSTKIIDLMASTCAVMAICWEKHCGYQYLSTNDAAFCIKDYADILPTLQKIADNPQLIATYAEKAYNCGRVNHNRSKIQKQLRDTFTAAIKNTTKSSVD